MSRLRVWANKRVDVCHCKKSGTQYYLIHQKYLFIVMIADQLHTTPQFTIVVVLGSTPTVRFFSPSQNVGEFLEEFVRTQLNQPPIPFEYFKDSEKQIPLLLDKTFAEQNITKDYIIYMDVQVSALKGVKKIKVVCEIEIKDNESVEDKVQHFFKLTNLQYIRKVDVKQNEVIDAKNTCASLNLQEGQIIYCQPLENQFFTATQTGSHISGPQATNDKFKQLVQVDLPVDDEVQWQGKQIVEYVRIIVNLQIEWNLQKSNLSIFTIHSLIRALKSQLEKLSQSEIPLCRGDSIQRCERTTKLSDYSTQQSNQIVFTTYQKIESQISQDLNIPEINLPQFVHPTLHQQSEPIRIGSSIPSIERQTVGANPNPTQPK